MDDEEDKKPSKDTKKKRQYFGMVLDPIAAKHKTELMKLFPNADETLLMQCADSYSTYRTAQKSLGEYVEANGTMMAQGNQPCGEFKIYKDTLAIYGTLRKQLGKATTEAEKDSTAGINGLSELPSLLDG